MNELSDSDIREICKKLHLPLCGVVTKDKLSHLSNGYYIVNMQSSKDGNGTHWCCCLIDCEKYNFWFDSFGFPAPEEVTEKIEPYIFNHKDIQDIDTSSCGYYCIAFIKFLNGKENKELYFKKFVNLFSKDTAKNEKILYNYLYLEK